MQLRTVPATYVHIDGRLLARARLWRRISEVSHNPLDRFREAAHLQVDRLCCLRSQRLVAAPPAIELKFARVDLLPRLCVMLLLMVLHPRR